jgi:hypothetical protein
MADSIEFVLTDWEAREVWHCQACGRYRHRPVIEGALPAICCSQPARLIDKYELPIDVTVRHQVRAADAR